MERNEEQIIAPFIVLLEILNMQQEAKKKHIKNIQAFTARWHLLIRVPTWSDIRESGVLNQNNPREYTERIKRFDTDIILGTRIKRSV